MSSITVSALSIYPVKSCRGINVLSSALEPFGLRHDRRWMVVDNKGIMLTQRNIARMCLLEPQLTETGLVLKYKTQHELVVAIPDNKTRCEVKVWNDICQAYDAGDDAADWLSHALSTECRLVYFPDNEFRQVDLDYAHQGDKTAFSDGFPLLLISQASLDDLNRRLTTPISMNRFRPNIVVQGCGAFEEDSWEKIKINNIIFRIVKPCSRCVIPSINIETAEKEDEPTRTLVSYRKRDNKIFFGQNVIANDTGNIEVGARVEILE